MKKVLMTILVVGVITIAVLAATNQVSSVNVAGYVKMELERGKYYMLRNDFFWMGSGDCTVSNVIGRQLPVNSKVYKWNGSSYTISTYTVYPFPPPAKTNWSVNFTLDVGEGFWVYIPSGAGQPTYTLNVLGEVPNNATSSIPFSSTYTILGYPYAASVAWTNTQLAKSAKVGDKLYLWNPNTQSYTISTYTVYPFPPPAKTNWSVNVTLDIGKSFWYYKTTAGTKYWNETRPYTLD